MVYFWFTRTRTTLFLGILLSLCLHETRKTQFSTFSYESLSAVVCQHYLPFFLQIFPPVPFIVSKSLICGNWYPVDQQVFAQCFSSEKGFGLILSIFCNFKKFFFQNKKIKMKNLNLSLLIF